jgi:hypothetical protein
MQIGAVCHVAVGFEPDVCCHQPNLYLTHRSKCMTSDVGRLSVAQARQAYFRLTAFLPNRAPC